MNIKQGKLLSGISTPKDIKKLTVEQLPALCGELRDYIIDIVSNNAGHLGASLGVVELTVALHYVYNTPYDLLVWDVGHQAYGHKILTERKDVFHTNRKYKGISGFPNMNESIYDAFGTGHASTSISAALGMATAARKKKEQERKIVAVIGDGSMTGGLAFEGLNNAGSMNSDILVILNDNNMAIDPNVGALKEYLLDITTSKTYNKLRNEVWNLMGKIGKIGPNPQHLAQKLETGIKSIISKQSNLFESLNFRYFGPVDGHDVEYLTKVLGDLKDIKGPKLLHVLTKKGKGFKQAELNQTAFHSPGKFNRHTGKLIKVSKEGEAPPKYQDVFGYTLTELAEENDKIVGITPAMPTGSSMNIMMKRFPDRAFDVGIAEQHAVTFSAGLAAQGLLPYCSIYSSFMQRAYDQFIHDVALQKLNVVLCLDRGGIVGEDGATHHGVFDLAYMRSIPNIIVAAPMNEIALRNLLYTAQLKNNGPFAIRYPRGRGVKKEWRLPFKEMKIGKGEMVSKGSDLAILSIGHAGNYAAEAVKELAKDHYSIEHYNMIFVKPLDEELLHQAFKKFKHVITIEDGTIVGGFGSAVLEFMSENNYQAQVKRLGVPDKFIDQGSPAELQRECGYDKEGIMDIVKAMVKKKVFSHVI